MSTRKRPRLVAADLDGTILDGTYQLSPALIKAVGKIRENGVFFTLATGRLYPSAISYARELGINIPVISYNGALVRSEGLTLLHRTLDSAVLQELFTEIANEPLRKYVFIGNDIFTDHFDEATQHYARALGVGFRVVDDINVLLQNDNPTMAVLRGEPDDIARVTPRLSTIFKNRLYLANSRPFFIDIASREVSKGQALRILAKHLQIEVSEVMVIGDSWNDVEMFACAGISVAVGNAHDAIKEKAYYVTKGHYAEGVVEALNKFVLI